MKPTPITIPRLRDQSSKLGELEKRREAIDALVVQKEQERLALGQADPKNDEPLQDPAIRRAAELLGEPAPPAPLDRKARLVALAGEIRDLRTASNLLATQMDFERRKASVLVCTLVQPEYRRRARAVCEALIGLHRANTDMEAMQTALQDEGVQWSGLGIMSNHCAGSARNPYGNLALDLRDGANLGFIAKSDIPEELRG